MTRRSPSGTRPPRSSGTEGAARVLQRNWQRRAVSYGRAAQKEWDMTRNALFYDVRAADALVAAQPQGTVVRDAVSTAQHAPHVVSDITVSYAPETAEGRHESLLCESVRKDAALVDFDAWVAAEPVEAHAFTPADDDEHCYECGRRIGDPTHAPDPAWRDMGRCTGCGAEGKRGTFHRADLVDPFLSFCGEYR